MKLDIECYPCFLKQTLLALNQTNLMDSGKIKIIRAVMDDVKDAALNEPPAYAMTFIFRKIRELSGVDPYLSIKKKYNAEALKLYPELRKMVFDAPDPLWIAARLAIAGNIIDFGIFNTVDIESTIERALKPDIELDDYRDFVVDADKCTDILYLLDNTGEMVFDRLLIEVLCAMGKTVTAAVKGAPVINDATREDADETGISAICRVIDNGTDAVGTILSFCSESFLSEYTRHEFVISKGQGNYETLVGSDKNIYFLLQAKCEVVARHLGLRYGAMLLKKNIPVEKT